MMTSYITASASKFSVAGPRACNCLPSDLRQIVSYICPVQAIAENTICNLHETAAQCNCLSYRAYSIVHRLHVLFLPQDNEINFEELCVVNIKYS